MVHCWEVKHRNGFPLHELYVTHFQRRPYCVHHIHFHLSQPLPSLILKCFLTSIILCWEIQFWTWNMMLLPIFKSEIMPTWQERRWWTLPMSSGLQTPTNSHPLGQAQCARSIMNIFVNGPLWMFLRTRPIMVVFTQRILTTVFSCESESGEIEIEITASCQSMSSIKP